MDPAQPGTPRRIELEPGLPHATAACLRPLDGRAELRAAWGPLALIDALLATERPGMAAAGDAASLTPADRDRLLAAIRRDAHGDAIRADAPCAECGIAFETRFSLAALEAERVSRRPDGIEGPDAGDCYRLAGGPLFRLPTGADLAILAAERPRDPRAALLARCVAHAADLDADVALRIEAAMEELSPALDVDLSTICPNCGSPQQVRFRLGTFLCTSLVQERPHLLRDIHRIARAYGWPLDTILDLARADRRALVGLIDAELPPAAGRRDLAA